MKRFFDVENKKLKSLKLADFRLMKQDKELSDVKENLTLID